MGADDPFEHLSTAVLSSFRVLGLKNGGMNAPGLEAEGERESIGDARTRLTVKVRVQAT